MTKREQLEMEIAAKKEQITKLKTEIIELRKETILLCDDKQWFTEEEEEHIIKKRPKIIEKFLVGKRHWKEDFKDEDTGEVVTIERCEVVRVNGEWK